MQLTRYTDYALRVLVFLALQPPNKLVTIADIRRHFSIPHNHLIKIVQGLARKGYAHTVRGRGGGLQLRRDASCIRLGEVVKDMENTLDLIDCEKLTCPLHTICRPKDIVNEASKAFIDVLNRYTLDEMIVNQRQIERVINWNGYQYQVNEKH